MLFFPCGCAREKVFHDIGVFFCQWLESLIDVVALNFSFKLTAKKLYEGKFYDIGVNITFGFVICLPREFSEFEGGEVF